MTEVAYRGVYRQAGGCVVVVEEDGADTGVLAHVVRHSPTGIGWGYGGSGPADCARSLLIAALGDAAKCPACHGRRRVVLCLDGETLPLDDPRLPANLAPAAVVDCFDCDDGWRRLPYQAFKFDVVARWPQSPEGWRITRQEIIDWLTGHGWTP